MRLADLQRRLSEALSDPRRDLPRALVAHIEQQGLSAPKRIDVYQANAVGALTRAIDASFPVCRQILGESYFGRLSREYALRHGARRADLDDYGESFPEHLLATTTERPELREFAYLSDLARLEWAIKQAWLAPDAPVFDLPGFQTSLNETPADRHRLLLAPSLRLLGSDWPVDRLWTAHQSGERPAELPAEARIQLCVCRQRDRVAPARLAGSEFQVLRWILAGRSLGELGEFAGERDMALDVLLPRMILKGWICGYSTRE